MGFLVGLFPRWRGRAARRAELRTPSHRCRPGLEVLESRELLASSAFHYDFGTASSPVAAGYQPVALTGYTAAQGYGWASTTGITWMDRGTPTDLLRDNNSGTDGTFLVNLPNGTYNVTVTLGDPQMRQNNIDIYLEGTKVGTIGSGNLGEVFNPTFNAAVKDGQLTLRLVDTGGSNPKWALNALDVVPATTNVPPVASIIAAPASGHSPEGTPLTLLAGVTDPDSTSFTYAWTVTKNGAAFASGTAASLDFTPDDNGTYAVSLVVTDSSGNKSALSSLSITADNVAPTADFGGAFGGVVGNPVAFGVSAVDPSAADTQAGFTYLWQFGDGATSTLQAPTHAYAQSGTYTVSCAVTDKNGGSTTVTTTAKIDPAQNFVPMAGVWSLGIPGMDTLPSALNNTAVDGIALRTHWDSLETGDGTYNWSFLDRNIASAAAAGKKVSISVSPGAYTPSWVYAAGAKGFAFTNNGAQKTIPVPWDPVYLAKWTAFVRALGARYAGNPAVAEVKITGVNMITPETMLPHTAADNQNWLAIGYTRTKLTNAWQTIADAWANAFPRQTIVMTEVPFGLPPIDENGKIIPNTSGDDVGVRQIISLGVSRYGRHFAVDNDGLSAQWISQAVTGVATQVTTGYQTLWNVTNDTTYRMNGGTAYDPHALLLNVVNMAVNGNARYVELYQADVINSALQDVITYAHNKLVDVAPTAGITGAPASGHSPEGTPLTLGSTVTDPNAVDVASGFVYAWKVTKNGAAFASGTGASFTFTPDDNGTYVASLVVTDRDSKSSSQVSKTILVDDVAPTAGITGPTSGLIGAALAFAPTVSDPSPLDAAAGLTYLWDFGDGTPARGQAPTHVYATAGAYTVRVTVTDKDGLSGTRTLAVVIN